MTATICKCTFHSIKPRHYSRHQLEQKLEESVCVDELDLDSNPERDLWPAEAPILCDLNVALEHVGVMEVLTRHRLRTRA